MSGAVQVGQLVINMAADVATLKTGMAEGAREAKAGAEKIAAELGAIKKGFQDAVVPLQDLTIKVGSLESNLNRAQASALSLGKGLILGAAAGMSIDAIAKKINGVIESMATLKTVSEKTGSSVENLSKLSFVAKQSGSDLDSVAAALAKMSKGMAGADDETKGAGRALAFLGISAKDSAGNLKDPAEMFVEIAKKLDGYQDGAGKAAIAQALFSKAGADMLPTLKLIGEQGDIVAKVTDAQATAARQYQRDLAKLEAQKNAVFKTIATALLPTMTDFAGAMLDASRNTNLANSAVKDLAKNDGITDWADAASMGLARVLDVIITIPRALKAISSSFKVVGADISMWATIIANRNNPVIVAQAMAERKKTVDDANQNYSDLWNFDGAAMEKAMAARIAARRQGGNASTKEKDKSALNFSTVNDDSKGGPRLNSLIANAQAELDSEKSIYDARAKMLDLYHTKFGLADAEFYAGRENARADYIAAEAVAYAKETSLALAAQAKARSPEEVASAKDKYAQLVNAHQQFVESMREAGGSDRANQEADAQKQYDDMIKAMHDAGVASIGSLDQQIAKQREHNAEIGKTKEQIELARQAQVDLATAQMQSDADFLRDGLAKWDLDEKAQAAYKIRLSDLDEEITRRRTLAGELAKGGGLEAGAKAAADLDKYLDPAKAKEFGNALKGSLATAARSMIELTSAMQKYGKEQDAHEKARAQAQILLKGDDKDRAKGLEALAEINRRSTKDQLSGYGNMASAAAGFFDEHSRGYQALTTMSQVFHAAELAMTMAELVPKAISAVLTQGQGDPYTAFGRMAAMGAIVAGLGVAIGGVGGASVSHSEERQKAQGAGTVFGDKGAKSDSIARSIKLSAANSSTQINYLSGMLSSLKSIESSMSGFTSLILRTTDIQNPGVGPLNSNNGGATTGFGVAAGAAIGAYFGPIGAAIGAFVGLLAKNIPIIGKIATSIFGGKQSVEDSGFTMDRATLSSILASGAKASQFAEIKTSGGWFSSDKYSTKTTPLGADANAQFTLVLKGLSDSVAEEAKLLGVTGGDFKQRLDSFVVDIGMVSLKGKTGEEIEKELSAVFSKVGDQMAAAAVTGLDNFAKAGEGPLETLTRIAADYAKVDASLQSIGMAFGKRGLESVAARESLIDLMGGIDKLQSSAAGFASNFLSKAEQLAPVAKYVDEQLASFGQGWIKSREDFKNEVLRLSANLSDPNSQKELAQLMGLQEAFAATHAATVDLSKSEQEIADERKDLLSQLDELTMSTVELRAKARAEVADENKELHDRVHAAQVAKDARALEIQIMGLQGDKLGELAANRALELAGMDESLRPLQQRIYALQDEASALQTSNSLLAIQAQIYELTGDKAGAAAVLQQQHAAALAAMDPALRESTQNLWDLQASAKATEDVKAAAATLLSGVDGAFTVLQRVTKTTTDALTARITAEKALSDAVKSTLSSMKAQGTEMSDRAAAQAQVKAALAIAKAGGPLPDASSMQKSLGILSQDAASMFATQQDYLKDFYSTQNDIAALGDLADSSLSVDQRQLDSLNSMLAAQQQQIDILKGIDTTGLTIAQALASFKGSVSNAQANPYAGSAAGINSAYQSLLGRAPDSGGLAFFQQAAAKGASLDEIRAAIMRSDEYKSHQKLLGIPGFAGGGDFGGGWRIVGENGPELESTGPARIFNASQTSSLLSRLSTPSGNSEALAAAVNRLNATAERQNAIIDEQGKTIEQVRRESKRHADFIERLTNGGESMPVKVVS
jgi:hypothetical protein